MNALTRREFAQGLIVSGVALAFVGCGRTPPRTLSPQWQLELHADGRILMLTSKVEMGQGVHTGLRTLLAEELDVSPVSIGIVQVPSHDRYGEILTGGSFSLFGWQQRIRTAGAVAREMLVRAAAQQWRTPANEVATRDGRLIHTPSGRTLVYADCVEAAAALEPPSPDSVPLKPRAQWRYIGKEHPGAWRDEIVSGAARYGLDMRVPGMAFAVLARAPVLGARIARVDDAAARKVRGFVAVVRLEGLAWPALDHCREAVAVVAENTWAAQQARAALSIEWTPGEQETRGSDEMMQELEGLCTRPGVVSQAYGDVDARRLTAGGLTLTAEYRQPWLAHAPLEPPNATARALGDRLEVWCGTQRQTRLKAAIVRTLELAPEHVVVHATLLGGSFGRRLDVDYGLEAARLAHALQRPVQVLWTRDDDLQCGLYRSGSVHRLAASLDASGRLHTFEHRYAAESVLRQQEPEQIAPDGGDWTQASPLVASLYVAPNVRLEHHAAKPMTPCTWWRGTFWTNVTTAVECFVDELCAASDQDPLAFRLAHLGEKREFTVNKDVRIPFDPARMRRVLLGAAERAAWSTAPPAGHARGLACGIYDSPECHAAVVVEMALRNGEPALVRAVVAVDVGIAVNPQIVRAQAMGGFVFGASAALRERITWRDGRVQQTGFQDYQVMRMSACPEIDVVIVDSDSGFCGVGELVTPAAMAAVSNAASRLLGRRVRSWPIAPDA
jgi:isoquinoline 1-oxidoreductase subunit beta